MSEDSLTASFVVICVSCEAENLGFIIEVCMVGWQSDGTYLVNVILRILEFCS